MSSMVLTQLLNPDSGIDRSTAGQAVENGGRSESGPSRYDEVVRQQEKRLEKRRLEDRAAQQRQEQSRQADREQDGRSVARERDQGVTKDRDHGSRKDAAEAAGERRTDGAGKARSADKRERTDGEQKTADAGQADDGKGVDTRQARADSGEGTDRLPADSAELTDLLHSAGPAAEDAAGIEVPPAAMMQGAAPAPEVATRLTSLMTGPGQKPGAAPTLGTLFAAMLEGGKESSGKGGDLLASLQSGNTQLLSESSGKFADTLTSQLSTRLSAPELTQSLNQASTLRGQEAQALMRNYSTSVDVPVGGNEWGEKVMGKLAWLTASQMSVAEIHITPPELGPIDVRVQVQNDQATVTVHAATPAVRDQLELHGHRLRDMLGEQGLSLEGFDVSDSPGREAADQQGDGDGSGDNAAAGQLAGESVDGDASSVAEGTLDLSWRGEVDLYA